MAFVTKVFSTTCVGDLLNAINNNINLPDCYQIITSGITTVDFEFSSALNGTEDAELDSVLSTWVCPIAVNENVVVDDYSEPETYVLWSSDKVSSEISNAILSSGISGEQICLQVRDTIGNTDIPLTYTNLNFNIVDIENDPLKIKRDLVNTNRVYVYDSGIYMASYRFTCDDEIKVRVRKNDTDTLPGSETQAGDPIDVNDVVIVAANTFFVELLSGDYISVQISATTSAEILKPDGIFTLTRMKGPKGDTGSPGANGVGLVNIQNEGISLVGQYGTLNFVGANVDAVDSGSNVTTVTVLPPTLPVFGTEYHYVTSNTVASTTSTSFIQKVSMTTSNLPNGTYRVGWQFFWNHNSTVSNFLAQVQVNNSITVMNMEEEPTNSAGTFGATGTSQKCSASGFIHIILSGINTIDIDFASNNAIDLSSIWDARIELWRVL